MCCLTIYSKHQCAFPPDGPQGAGGTAGAACSATNVFVRLSDKTGTMRRMCVSNSSAGSTLTISCAGA